ncbi:piggyBac transposable element-derived protein 4-like [Leptopilina boulardi]|uniref:piggyBac transposable element-derived protein 4-like n=1 Tax=Leptopilina boulardi TaxID=63433 RepID=UPI0021F5934F|nr:piggyBac transposable element-derived protein 4-like [Leptopilina boulardi]
MNTRSRVRKNLENFSLPSDPEDSEGDIESEEEERYDLSDSDDDANSVDQDSDDTDCSDSENPHNTENGKWVADRWNCRDNLNFEKDPTILVQMGKKVKESDFFDLFFTQDILQKIVEETNMYFHQNKKKESKYAYELSIDELRAWIGMLILMGIHRLPQQKNFWSTDPALRVDFIANIMTRDRFSKIAEILHLNDNNKVLEKSDPNYDRLFKVRPLVDHLNKKAQEIYSPSKVLAVDESMIKFKGRSSLKQYMPMKPIKRGYKVWCLADSQSSYILKFEIYTGKSTDSQKSQETLGERVVTNLTKDLRGSKSLVAFDNFFTSVDLVTSLLQNQIFSVGTVRVNRKGLPEIMKNKKN